MTTSTHGPSERGLLVLCAANNFDDVRLSDRPLAEALAARGPVLYVDPPLSHLTPRNNPRVRAALDGPRLREVAPGLWRLTPVVTPFAFRARVVTLTRLLARRALRRALARLASRLGEPEAVISTWLDVDVFDLAPEARHAYWVQDDVATGAALWGIDAARILAAEERVAAAADVVLVASPTATPAWRERVAVAETLPNGCDPERFAGSLRGGGPDLPVLPPDVPVAAFVGHLNGRSDLALLSGVVDRGLTLLLVGPIDHPDTASLERLLARPEVIAAGAQPFEDLPHWLDLVDVGLLPYRDAEFNRLSFPLKTLEYLVAGLPVVSTELPASRWLASPDVVVADAGDFAAEAERVARTPSGPSDVARRRGFATTHSWSARADQVERLLGATSRRPVVR